MTAEIAIINRSAVTLAADSAMSLQVRGREKIYTSADKLFELCGHHPIGIMVYNTPEFFGVPIELAVKQFREKNKSSLQTVKAASDEFLAFLMKDFAPDANLIAQNIFSVTYAMLRALLRDFESKARDVYLATKKAAGKSKSAIGPHDVFLSVSKDWLKRYESFPRCDGDLGKVSVNDVLAAHKDVIDKAIKAAFSKYPLSTDVDIPLLEQVCAYQLTSDMFSDQLSGLVFAGFGEEELFPSLISVEMDGIVCGHLKKKVTHEVVTHRGSDGAEVIPFAQREMADRFMNGIDPEFEDGVTDLCAELLNSVGNLIIKESKSSKAKTNVLHAKLKSAVDQAIANLRTNWLPEIKKKFKEQVEDMVLFMAKPELASLAEALVNLTSIKRKFSAEAETVAGPVDVAVISKSDGFIWVKRKHYFEAELNPGYFHRKFKSK